MQPYFNIVLHVLIFFISGAFSVAPGDPFRIINKSNFSGQSNLKHISNKIHSSSELKSTEKYLMENESLTIVPDNSYLNEIESQHSTTTTSTKSAQETLPIYRKHLVQIAQWKYTDPATHQTRYWYHTLGSIMGDGWIFDGILCQAYIREKPDTIPIHAFHSESKDIWTNTLQTELNLLPIGNNQWQYDGIHFYAYKTSMNSSLLKPVWRYWNRINYGTEDVSEPRRSYLRMDTTIDDNLRGWRVEHLLFYAFPPDFNVTELEILKMKKLKENLSYDAASTSIMFFQLEHKTLPMCLAKLAKT